MKKLALFMPLALVIACSSGPTEEQKKMQADMIESNLKDLEKSVDDYCNCVNEKGVDACADDLDRVMSNHTMVQSAITSNVETGYIDKAEKAEELRNRARQAFDRKAQCAKDAMNKPVASDTTAKQP